MGRSRLTKSTFFGFVLAAAIAAAQAQNGAVSSTVRTHPDSGDGLQAQVGEIITLVAHSNDQMTTKAALDFFGIPNADKWCAAHFDSRFVAQLPQEYAKVLSTFQSHVSWVAANFAKFDDFGLRVEPLDNPRPLADSGFESLLPKPVDVLKIENYRFTSTSSDPKHGPPSWVSSFVYIDGQFRFVGGTYPFWTEGLTGLRGPMSIPPAVIHGRTVQGIAFRKDQKQIGIDAIVQLKVNVGRTGKVDHIKVLSGDVAFVQDAKDYVKAADFGPLPDIPQLANAKREWEVEVAFFTAKN
ncbi:MAG: hypothetical protein WCA76_12640 [Candidatus Sulfotelmatobacter sp.]|jgi:hypothetical protein